MSEANKRKKQPNVVRHQLLDVATRLCIESGLHSLTLDAVAKEAGVSKGGLLHHFPSKQDLLEALNNSCLEELDRRLAREMEKDKGPAPGRFARAYLLAVSNRRSDPKAEQWDSLGVLLIADAGMRSAWNAWLTQRLDQYKDSDNGMNSLVVRLAADGLWLSDSAGSPGISQACRKRLVLRLLELSREAS